ncbi:MAG: hypothetical protein AAGG44_10800, partial [Planctomycetota bacterium]
EEGPIEITLSYVACDDAETWCNRLTQKFVVTQKADPDAGRVTGQRPGAAGGRGGFGGGRNRRNGFDGGPRSGRQRGNRSRIP